MCLAKSLKTIQYKQVYYKKKKGKKLMDNNKKPQIIVDLSGSIPYCHDMIRQPDHNTNKNDKHEETVRFTVIETSDAFTEPYAVWNNKTQDYYVTGDGTVPTFDTPEEAAAFCRKLNEVKNYTIPVKVTGFIEYEIDANSEAEAKKIADQYMQTEDFNKLTNINWNVQSATDVR